MFQKAAHNKRKKALSLLKICLTGFQPADIMNCLNIVFFDCLLVCFFGVFSSFVVAVKPSEVFTEQNCSRFSLPGYNSV